MLKRFLRRFLFFSWEVNVFQQASARIQHSDAPEFTFVESGGHETSRLKSGQSGWMEGKVELEYSFVRAVRIEPSDVRSWFSLGFPVHFLAAILQLLNDFFFVRVSFHQHVQIGTGNKIIDRRRLGYLGDFVDRERDNLLRAQP